MSQPKLAKDIMIEKVVTLRPDMDLFDAIALLLKHRISGAPVVDDQGMYIGVFSEISCLRMLVKAAYDQLPTTQLFAFVATDDQTIDESTDLLTIAQLFLSTEQRRLPVLREGKLVGQVSRRDVLSAAHSLMAITPEQGSDILYLSSTRDRSEVPIG